MTVYTTVSRTTPATLKGPIPFPPAPENPHLLCFCSVWPGGAVTFVYLFTYCVCTCVHVSSTTRDLGNELRLSVLVALPTPGSHPPGVPLPSVHLPWRSGRSRTFSEFLCFGICFPDKHIPQMSSDSHTRADRYAECSGVLSLPSNFLHSVLGTECRN